jgi:hypothetical protein
MSTQESNQEASNGGEAAQQAQDGDALASKLSKELSNWRRRRTSSRPMRNESGSSSFQADAARTIKVRGHETLVIRKPKLNGKPSMTPDNSR